MEKPAVVYAELDDPKLAASFKATLEREQRSMKAVVTLALRDYIAKSEADAQPTAPEPAAPSVAA